MADRLKVTTTLVLEYEWDGKPFDELSRDELLEAAKDLAKRVAGAQHNQQQDWARLLGPARSFSGPLVVADAFAGGRIPNRGY